MVGINDAVIQGPYKLKEALKEQKQWRAMGVLTFIVQPIIDENGKEVK